MATTSNEKKVTPKSEKPDKNYSLIREIRAFKEYKHSPELRDRRQRKYLEENLEVTGPRDVMPGQLIYFNYLEPATKEELEYYDAKPCTIFFGTFKNQKGEPRIIGFNIHYYPPRIRYQIMDRIMEIWKPMYLKTWETGLNKEMSRFDYEWLMQQLENTGLAFGVRMYIPNLTGAIRVVPPKDWVRAVFTEGVFRKSTRAAILNYWKQFRIKHKA